MKPKPTRYRCAACHWSGPSPLPIRVCPDCGVSPLIAEKPSKYRNRWTICGDGHRHQSAREAKRCDELSALARAGAISNLVQQPRYELHAFADVAHAYRQKVGHYIADFRYLMGAVTIVEDAKSPYLRKHDRVYNLKKKIVAANYGIEIVEI